MSTATGEGDRLRGGLLARFPWLTFVLPLLVYMLVGSLEPAAPKRDATNQAAAPAAFWQFEYEYYPLVYAAKIALTLAAIALVWPGYRQFPFRVNWVAPLIGAIGVVIWIGLCELGLVERLLALVGLGDWVESGVRPAFNSLKEMADRPALAYAFLVLRFLGLAAVVPLIEEFFLRGFVLRFLTHANWWSVPLTGLSRAALVAGSLLPVLWHPAHEVLAVMAWFSLVTWLMLRTKSIWDCVVAHAVTNGLLGVYVVVFGQWQYL